MDDQAFMRIVKKYLNEYEDDDSYMSSDFLSSNDTDDTYDTDETYDIYNNILDGGLGKHESTYIVLKKKGCAYCEDAVKLLKKNNKTYDASVRSPTDLERKAMTKAGKKDYPYFPKIFHLNKSTNALVFVGGYSELKHLLV